VASGQWPVEENERHPLPGKQVPLQRYCELEIDKRVEFAPLESTAEIGYPMSDLVRNSLDKRLDY
jgi:hypothetical protein